MELALAEHKTELPARELLHPMALSPSQCERSGRSVGSLEEIDHGESFPIRVRS
jgi:hypothetical protein